MLGRLDGKITRDEALSQVRTIVAATDLPVSADLEKGFGDTPEIVAETVRLAADAGLAGCSIEDATGQSDRPLFDFGLAVERVAAAVQVARALPFPFTLTARSENFLRGNPNLDDTIKRLQAFEKAGADALFAPLLPDLAAVRAVCSAVSKPVNFMVGVPGKSFSVAELAGGGREAHQPCHVAVPRRHDRLARSGPRGAGKRHLHVSRPADRREQVHAALSRPVGYHPRGRSLGISMSIPESLRGQLRLPVIGSPLFIVSNPRLVIEQCKAGVVGSFPALNARPAPVLEEWLVQITEELAAFKRQHPERKVAPYAVNQIVHASNDRLASDIALCEKYRVPIQITSLRAPDEVVQSAHSYGGLVYHDVTNVKHAKRALQAGVDGLILVCSGAGGHAGSLSPFALLAEVREFYDGTVILSGAIANGSAILAAQAMGADFAYMGTRFIATEEANASAEYKQALIDSQAEDIVYTNLFTGVHGNYLRSSIVNAGLDPDALPVADKTKMNFASGGNTKSKAWRDIWGSGQGVADIHEVLPVSALVDRLEAEYTAAKKQLDRDSGHTSVPGEKSRGN